MLRLVLDRGEAAIPPESMFLADFAPVRRSGGLDDPERARRFLEEVWRHPRVRLWGLEDDPPPLPASLDHEEAYRFCVEAPFRAYARGRGKKLWGDKTPAYLRLLDELGAVWPQARFVVLVRDGRDVALSVIGVPFGANNVWAAARWWAAGIRLGLEAERRLPGRVLRLRYEDLVEHPAEEVRRVCDFLGLRYDDELLAIERTERSKVLEDQAGWFTNVWTGINTSAVGKWRRELSPRAQRLFAAVAGSELEELGYEPGPAGRMPASAPLYAGHDAVFRLVNFVRLRLLQERGRELRYVLRRKLAGALR